MCFHDLGHGREMREYGWKRKRHRLSSTSSSSHGVTIKISQIETFKNVGKKMKSFDMRV